ncbi:class IIb bacteriocin, lactobin A/cerein 7B family [Flavobacterium sp. ACAM 123]|jgi:lactobin A/cerein 7B family class IIb bacteriocin|uniref:class IIb bacteriocin, lactobin A/cerein 7B family n=1 Tax=Flavobacterium sp. ACAM 123 TaxID=1189620 RepID=UPI0012F77E73|nr:class IIb bacteriocin, lactobin A/cerein 7B family [Flavobacterium sp. ACAM 123]
MTNCVGLTDLNNEELMAIEGGILPLLAIPVLIKGIGLGFAAAAAVYGMIALGNQME